MKAAFTFAILAALCGPAAAREAEPVMTTLENGVTVVVQENHQSPVVALRAYVHAGSMMEGDQGMGMTHLLEHLVAGGTTAQRTEKQSRQVLDSIGAQSNAYTSRDHACYYMTTASRFFDTGVDLLSDWVMNCTIPPEEFKRELEVVQREMESRRSDPQVVLRETMARTMFRVHPARYPVLGFRDSFRAITRDEVYRYYKHTYVPDNVLFVAVGDIDAKAALARIGAAFAKYERKPAPMYVLPEEPPQMARRIAVREIAASQAYLMIGYRTVPLTHPDLYALDLLSFVLGHGESSRLVRKVREEQRLLTSVTAWSNTPGYDAGDFSVAATCSPDKLAAAQEAILAEIRRLRDDLVGEDELQSAKKQKVAEYAFGLQTAEAQAASLALDILEAHDPRFSRQYVQRIQDVTAEEMRQAARRYLTDDKLCLAVVRPPVAETAAAPAAAAPPAAEETVKTVLPNGLRLLVKRNDAAPIVTIQAVCLAGLRAEPQGRSGLSMFTARMLPRGTATRSAAQIAALFAGIGGSLSAASGSNTLYLSASCLSGDLPQALDAAADILRNPAFAADEIERLRPLLLAASKRQHDDWHEELSLAFRRDFFQAHPYRNPMIGLPADIAALTRDDLVAFHRRFVIPNNMVLAVFGDVDPAQVKAAVEKLFGAWPAGKLETLALAAEPPSQQDRSLAEKTALRMGGVFIGYSGMTFRDEKDRYAMDVFNAILAGIRLPRGWLHETLRGKGLVYEVHAYNFVGVEPGFFGIYAGCEPAKVEEVKRTALDQVGRIFREKIAEGELEAARRICVTADVLDRQTNEEQALRAALDELYGLGYDADRRYPAGVLAVSEEDVRRVAKKYLTHYLCVTLSPDAPAAK